MSAQCVGYHSLQTRFMCNLHEALAEIRAQVVWPAAAGQRMKLVGAVQLLLIGAALGVPKQACWVK